MIEKVVIANRGEIALRILAGVPRARHQDRGRAFDRRFQHQARPSGGRDRLHRAAAGRAVVSEHARHHQRRGGDRLGRHPSGLRIPVRERGFRGARREERLHLRRAARRDHPPDGRQGLRDQGDEGFGRAVRAGFRRPRRRTMPTRTSASPRTSATHSSSRPRAAEAAAACAWSTPTPRSSMRSASPNPRRLRHSAIRRSTWRNSSSGRGISNFKCLPTTTAMWCTWANAIARCSAAIKRCSKKRPHRGSPPNSARPWASAARGHAVKSDTATRARSSSCIRTASSTSSR